MKVFLKDAFLQAICDFLVEKEPMIFCRRGNSDVSILQRFQWIRVKDNFDFKPIFCAFGRSGKEISILKISVSADVAPRKTAFEAV